MAIEILFSSSPYVNSPLMQTMFFLFFLFLFVLFALKLHSSSFFSRSRVINSDLLGESVSQGGELDDSSSRLDIGGGRTFACQEPPPRYEDTVSLSEGQLKRARIPFSNLHQVSASAEQLLEEARTSRMSGEVKDEECVPSSASAPLACKVQRAKEAEKAETEVQAGTST